MEHQGRNSPRILSLLATGWQTWICIPDSPSLVSLSGPLAWLNLYSAFRPDLPHNSLSPAIILSASLGGTSTETTASICVSPGRRRH